MNLHRPNQPVPTSRNGSALTRSAGAEFAIYSGGNPQNSTPRPSSSPVRRSRGVTTGGHRRELNTDAADWLISLQGCATTRHPSWRRAFSIICKYDQNQWANSACRQAYASKSQTQHCPEAMFRASLWEAFGRPQIAVKSCGGGTCRLGQLRKSTRTSASQWRLARPGADVLWSP